MNGAAVGEGTEFPPVAEFLGRKTPLIHRIVEYAPPRGHIPQRELHRDLVRQDQVRLDRGGHTIHLRRRPRAEGTVQHLRSLLGLAFTHVGDHALAGLTRSVRNIARRARTIAVYTDVRKVVDNLGLASTDTIAVQLVGRSGAILAGELGGFDEQRADRLASALATTLSRTTASVT